MIRVLFISDYLNVAGTETFMMNVIRASGSDIKYDFLLNKESHNSYVDEANQRGCQIFVMPSRRKAPLKYLTKLYTFFKEHASYYDAVHWCGGVAADISGLIMAWLLGIPVRIVHAHNSSCTGLHVRILHNINKYLLPFICTDYMACSSLASKFFFGDKDATIINNGIDLERYKYNQDIRCDYRNQFQISEDEFVIGHVGRFTEVKNQSFLVDILDRLISKEINVKLLLIGKGELLDLVQQKVNNLGLANRVVFLGERNDINNCMQAMDCFVMPSLYEGLPFVLVEAQAAGLPCVISSSINSDAILTPHVVQEDIENGVESWCSSIIRLTRDYKRQDTSNYLIEKGFSMFETARYLRTIYSRNNGEK